MTDLIPRDAAIEEAFMDAVWVALKADATDLGKQQRILTAVRAIPAIDPAAIRDAAMREAANLVESHRKQALDKMPSPYLMSRNDAKWVQANSDVMKILSTAILALIGEKK